MLSNLIITNQKLVLIIDDLGQEKIAQKFICQVLREQGQEDIPIKTLPLNCALKEESSFDTFITDCSGDSAQQWNVLLPALSDLLCYQRPAVIFQFLQRLRKDAHVKRVFLWISTQHVMQPFLVAAFEYMADLVLHLQTAEQLSIITRKPGGGVTNKQYTYKRDKNQFLIEATKSTNSSPEKTADAPSTGESMGTFKIELDEDELVARNALKLPYEKTSEEPESNIIYTPDTNDDFDEEDPDEDLCI